MDLSQAKRVAGISLALPWVFVAFLVILSAKQTSAQELVTYPSQEVAFVCGPQLRSNSPLNPYPWFDSTATTKGASIAAALPSKGPRVLTGTVSVNTNSSIVIGNGTRFLAEIDLNGPAPFYDGWLRILQGGIEREVKIASIQSDTQLTLTAAWSFGSVSGTQADTFHVHQGTLNFNDFETRLYYDTALTMYINYYRTNDPAFLGYARKLADAWWSREGINFGTVVSGPTDLAPRTQAYAGLMLRALDGKPEYWDYLYRQVRAKFDHYVKQHRDAPMMVNDTREQGYAQLYAVLLARVLPNSYSLYGNGTLSSSTGTATDGAQKRAALLADTEDLAVNYFGRLQKPDGSWRWDTVGPERNIEQPFMVGLYLESVILLHQLTANTNVKTNLVNQLTNSVRHLHNDTYQKNVPVTNFPPYKWRAVHYFWGGGTVAEPNLYNPPAPMTTACGLSQCGDNSVAVARHLNSTIHHAFGYAYLVTGDAQYKAMGDEMFGASYGDSTDTIRGLAADAGGKEYAMNFRASGRYLAWRIMNSPTGGANPVVWTNLVNTMATGNTLEKTAGELDAGAISQQQLTSAGGYVEFKVSVNHRMQVGLSNDLSSSVDYTQLKYTFNFWGATGGGTSSDFEIREGWENWRTWGTYTANDVFRIAVEGGIVKYYKNGTLIYTSTVAPTYPLVLDTAITTMGGTIQNAVISTSAPPPVQNVVWTNLVNTMATGNTLEKTAGELDAGAISQQQLTSAGGYVEFKVSVNHRMQVGLSNDLSSSVDYTQLKYTFNFWGATGGGTSSDFEIREGWENWRTWGTYTANDVFRIAVEGGIVKYYKNGTLIYTSTVAPTYPLVLDTALTTMGSTVQNAVIKLN